MCSAAMKLLKKQKLKFLYRLKNSYLSFLNTMVLIPGVLKALIDNSDIKNVWNYKKALLTGVATGRAGNLRGMDHLSDTLHFMKMNVFYNKLPISVIDKVMDNEGHFNEETMKAINHQLDEFIVY